MTRLPTIADVDADLVAAARDGDPTAVEQLVAAYLPLVYNVIGRALNRGLDVDDTVQETMLHVVRGLPELRDPAAFRSWLLAITMNEVRRHHRQRVPELRPLEAFDALIEPVSDFADLTIWRLGLTGQRMETAKAASWLDDQDRELMSLWFLVEAGQLSRAEMVAVLGVGAHTTTVRVTRMKSQLAVARAIVRALAITPPCPGLTAVAADWSGVPSPLWRKRFARHMRECDDCVRVGADLIPAEHLLPGLLPLPVGLAGMVSSKVVRPAAVRPLWHHGLSQTAAHRRIPGRSGLWSGKAAVGAVGATVAIGGAAAVFVGMGGGGSTSPASSAPTTARVTAPAPTTIASPVVQPDPTSSGATTSPSPKPTTVPSSLPATAGAEEQTLAVINKARAANGLPALTRTDGLNHSSAAHNKAMLSGCGLSHNCPGEPDLGARESAAGVSWSSAGENIGEGGATRGSASAVASMAVTLTDEMLAEKPPNDGHRQNILSTDFHHIGISVMQDASGTVWLTTDFSD